MSIGLQEEFIMKILTTVIKVVEKWLVKKGYRFPEEAAEIAENLISYNNKVTFKETTNKMRDEIIELLG